MSWLHRHLNQVATYWARSGRDSAGDQTWTAPKLVKVRWEEGHVNFTTAFGDDAVASAVVFVKEDMSAGDALFLGNSAAANPTTVTGHKLIQGFSKIPALINRNDWERKAFLSARDAI